VAGRALFFWLAPWQVVGQAGNLPGKSNPRFVVINLPISRARAKRLYEKL
jgi:hypothetical protein